MIVMMIKLIFDDKEQDGRKKLLTWFVLYGEARGIHKRLAWCSILRREEGQLESVSILRRKERQLESVFSSIFCNAAELFSLLKI